jgi:excisionase family DNA binding protein
MDILTPEQAAKILKVSTRKLRTLRATRGAGPPFLRIGYRTIRYRRADLEAWVARQAEREAADG